MIVADTSALLSVLLAEHDAEMFGAALEGQRVVLSAVSLVEAGLVVESRHGLDGARELELLVEDCVSEVVACDLLHARVAVKAWRRFGKGRHPAALNFGDCVVYATAQLADAPLLFKGNDFAQTDLRSALTR